MLSTLLALLALVVSAAALLIAWWQLVLQRDVAGGRGIVFGVVRPHRLTETHGDVVTITDTYRIVADLVGNDRHQMAVHLERGGRPVERGDRGYVEPPALVRRMTCEHDPIDWEFELSPDDAEDLWAVLTWADPFGQGLRITGYRCKLDPPSGEYQEWHWYRTYRVRRAIENWGARHRWACVRRWLGKPRRLGTWRPYHVRELKPGQSPLDSRAGGSSVL